MKKGKWQSKDDQNVEAATGPGRHNSQERETVTSQLTVYRLSTVNTGATQSFGIPSFTTICKKSI